MSDDTIARLCDAILETINEFADNNRLTTGQAMGALFEVLVMSAKSSPQYDPKQLVAEVSSRIREAVELQ